MKVERLSALRPDRLYPPEDYPWYSFLLDAHIAAYRIKSVKNPNYPTGNRTGDLTSCSTVPQPTVQSCILRDDSEDHNAHSLNL